MRIAVISCAAYRDCWGPFVTLFRRFWPHCEYPLWLVTDEGADDAYDHVFALEGNGADSWCKRIAVFADSSPEPILFFLDDFFLSRAVNRELVERGRKLFEEANAGCVRLHPCPGASMECEDKYFGIVGYSDDYRISTMPAIWKPAFLSVIASQCNSPWSFEIDGTKHSRRRHDLIFAWKREVQPWPLEFICTGILRSKWTQGALKLFKEQDIYLDSTREVSA